jgi:hypothetical protein
VGDPKATVEFDSRAEAATLDRVSSIGADGKLLTDAQGEIIHVTLLEKLLIPALAKLSNFVPGGGIWMNTQRPEWNDANNALVGHGLSVVTLAYLRRYLEFISELVPPGVDSHPVSVEVIDWLEAIVTTLESHPPPINAGDRAGHRAQVLRELGRSFSRYREHLYANGLSRAGKLDPDLLGRLFRAAGHHLDDALQAAVRADGLFDAYNLLRLATDGSAARVERLPQMLEGQVAAISSGLLTGPDVADLVDALYESELYRPDVDSFLLYPATIPPSFMDRNRVPEEAVDANPLLMAMLERDSDEVLSRDAAGSLHFNADLRNAGHLSAALDHLTDPEIVRLVDESRAETLDLFESVFKHHAFTGRSSSMYAYEGIGSVYWHMVAKLLLAVQEQILARPETADGDRLIAGYERIRAGLGFNKTAADYGAFPTDPYSHTPAHAGAQQPGMTGQVKEELLARWAELGLIVKQGAIRFDTRLLHRREFNTEPGRWTYHDASNHEQHVPLAPDTFGFTISQVPVIVHLAENARLVVTFKDGTDLTVPGLQLSAAHSQEVFDRTGVIQQLDVYLDAATVRS